MSLGFAFVKKFSLGGIVATENDFVIPAAKIADDLEVI